MAKDTITRTGVSTRTKLAIAALVLVGVGVIGYASAVIPAFRRPMANLTMTITESADPVIPDTYMDYTVVVTNTGTTSSGPFTYTMTSIGRDFFNGYSTGAGTSTCTQQLPTATKPSRIVCTDNLAAGASTTVTLPTGTAGSSIPACGTTETVTIEGVVDTTSAVRETDETNNNVSETTTLNSNAC